MNCQNCKRSTVIERVIVERITDTVIGGLCEPCERYFLSESDAATVDAVGATTECFSCDDRAYYVLPRLECMIQSNADSGTTVEYSLTRTTPRVCGAHLSGRLDKAPLADLADVANPVDPDGPGTPFDRSEIS